jgi:2-polyprenyl-3-methyl-5-hydroxy-6-metoxy-1,4-benzoquinol methylase
MKRISFKEIQSFYENLYNEKKGESFLFDESRTISFLKPLLIHPNSTDKVLDIGCGVGYACKILQDHDYLVYGIDISATALEIARNNLPTAQFQLANPSEKLGFENEYFEAIVCLGVLEHIENPQTLIQECYRVLKGGSLAVFVVPNALSPYFLVNKNGTGQILEVPRRAKEWENIFEGAGFKIISLKRDPGPCIRKHDNLMKKIRLLLHGAVNFLPLNFTYQFNYILQKM